MKLVLMKMGKCLSFFDEFICWLPAAGYVNNQKRELNQPLFQIIFFIALIHPFPVFMRTSFTFSLFIFCYMFFIPACLSASLPADLLLDNFLLDKMTLECCPC